LGTDKPGSVDNCNERYGKAATRKCSADETNEGQNPDEKIKVRRGTL